MSQNRAPAVRKAFRKLWILSTLSAVVLMNLISTDTRAQDVPRQLDEIPPGANLSEFLSGY